MLTSAGDTERLEDLWWSGIRLWYNEGADGGLHEAMQTWQQAIDSVEWVDESIIGQEEEGINNHVLPDSDCSQEASFLAPLLLFLGGCYLDATDTRSAQILLRRCLSTPYFRNKLMTAGNGDENNNFAFSAISEYVSSFEEDLRNKGEPWKIGFQIAEWAIEERKKCSASFSDSATSFPPLWSDPYHRPGYMYTPLASKAAFGRPEHPDWCRKLEEHFPVILDEYQYLISNGEYRHKTSCNNQQQMPQHWPCVGGGDHRDGAGAHDDSVLRGGDWREIVLFGSGARPHLAPKTCAIIQKLAPEAVHLAQQGAGEIIFSVLAPHTYIAPHCASSNVRLTAHLGLQVPLDKENCYIQVADEKLHWEEGKIIVFDDSYQHEVHNKTDKIRAVLLLRFWHCNIPLEDRQKALQYIFDAKDYDQLKRCNPPLPPNGSRNARGMEQSLCPTCGRTGFQSIRLVYLEDQLFACVCGQEVR